MTYITLFYAILFLSTTTASFYLGKWWVLRSYKNKAKEQEDSFNLNEAIAEKKWKEILQRLDDNQKLAEEKINFELEKISTQDFPRLEFSTMKYQLTTLINDQKKLESNVNALTKRIDTIAPGTSHDLISFNDRVELIEHLIKKFENANKQKTENDSIPPELSEEREIQSEPQGIINRIGFLKKTKVLHENPNRINTNTPPIVLSSPKYGPKDNLQKIQGIDPKLELLLNKHGIFYIWQIAEWNSKDTQIIESLLHSSNHRIETDNWVGQAKNLVKKSAPISLKK